MFYRKRSQFLNSSKILRIRRKFILLKRYTLQLISHLFYLFHEKCLSQLERFKSKINYKNFILFFEFFCLTILLKSGFDVTSDYLSFPFEYKLIVSVNKYGFDFPSISVCTENNVLFDKRKIIEHFGIQKQWKEFDNKLFEEFKQTIDECNQTIQSYSQKRFVELNESEFYEIIEPDYIKVEINQETIQYPLECFTNIDTSKLFLNKINERIYNELDFYEMNSLTINVNQLFECSAKVHFRNESFDSNAHEFINCFQYFEALKSIYANKDFGICFEFFAKNYSIYLKDDDYVELIVKYSGQSNTFVNALQEMNNRFITSIASDSHFINLRNSLKLFFNVYYGLYFIVDPKTRLFPHNKENAFKSTRNSLNAELMITKSSVELMSQPYMDKCIKYGKFDSFLLLLKF